MLFVTGTGTEVGKTWFSVALIEAWRAQGHSVLAVKPFETGCDPQPLDALALANACRMPHLAMLEGFFRAKLPVAPWAAVQAGEGPPDLDAISTRIDELRNQHVSLPRQTMPELERTTLPDNRPQRVLVEGAGGPLVPLTEDLDIADWAVGKFDSVVLVAADRLGVLSHTFTAVESLERRSLPLKAVVLNATETSDPSQERNLKILQARLEVPVFRMTWNSRLVDPFLVKLA